MSRLAAAFALALVAGSAWADEPGLTYNGKFTPWVATTDNAISFDGPSTLAYLSCGSKTSHITMNGDDDARVEICGKVTKHFDTLSACFAAEDAVRDEDGMWPILAGCWRDSDIKPKAKP